MAYRGHQKAFTAFLAACGLGGAGYGTRKYIKFNNISTDSMPVPSYDATSTLAVSAYTTVTASHTYTTYINPTETEVLVEGESQPAVPPNTAFRKQGLVGRLSYTSIILGFVLLLLPAFRNVGFLGLGILGLTFLVTFFMPSQSLDASYLLKMLMPPQVTKNDAETQFDEVGEQAWKRLQMLEDMNAELKDGLEKSKDEITRLTEQHEIDKAHYKRKKEHYKAVAHYVVSAGQATKGTERTREDSLQRRIRKVMTDNNEKLLASQQEAESLRTQLTLSNRKFEIMSQIMSQKLAQFEEEATLENAAIEARMENFLGDQDARFQELIKTSAEREKSLRGQLEEMQTLRITEMIRFEGKIRALDQTIAQTEKEKDMALGNLRKHAQDLERNLISATREKDAAITAGQTEIEALKASMSSWLKEEATLTKAISALKRRVREVEEIWSKEVKEKEEQIQEERSIFEHRLAQLISVSKDRPQQKAKKTDFEQKKGLRPAASRGAGRSAPLENPEAHNGDVGAPIGKPVEPADLQRTTASIEIQPKEKMVPPDLHGPKDEEENLQEKSHDIEQKSEGSTQQAAPSPTFTPDPPTNGALSPESDISTSRGQPQVGGNNSVSDSPLERAPKPNIQKVEVTTKGETESSSSPSKDPSADLEKSTQSQSTSTPSRDSVSDLQPTVPVTGPTHNISPSVLPDLSKAPPILFNFAPVDFTASAPRTAQPPTIPESSPHDIADQLTSTPPEEQRYFESLLQGRRNTEAEIGTRRRLQRRRRNQTLHTSSQMTPGSQPTASILQSDPRALADAMPRPPVVPADLDALGPFDKANVLGKFFPAQEAPSANQPLNAPSAPRSIFEGKTFDLQVPLPATKDADDDAAVSARGTSAVVDNKDGSGGRAVDEEHTVE